MDSSENTTDNEIVTITIPEDASKNAPVDPSTRHDEYENFSPPTRATQPVGNAIRKPE